MSARGPEPVSVALAAGTTSGATTSDPDSSTTSISGRAGSLDRDWLGELTSSGAARETALRDLHVLLVKAARHQVARMRGLLPRLGAVEADELANAAADEALVHLLGRLSTFEGRARFTTWAYKFAILQTANEVRRRAWASTEIALSDHLDLAVEVDGPESRAEANELAHAVAAAMTEALTTYQRRIAIALLVEGVPVDVLAERLGTTRGALYKTLHVARSRIRAHLVAAGHLPAGIPFGGTA
ncbi:RNA polymerase subunit sigma24 [Intrasporangium chromatireducens Q5-1]|uniref:RNA polymerase subunit sigma24 n=1 Tax=Intrasporangium chromatireducens Q5-1 TaxID=584657 RepID=W9GGM4_9MICO|nr:sigma-70 family RNA polymerase sigma factor [Intrasporangium chromatireducens]EWT03978.1 RNA polymerase subunit sigma24 [Intrasporangium chromatireducens Q5-1]